MKKKLLSILLTSLMIVTVIPKLVMADASAWANLKNTINNFSSYVENEYFTAADYGEFILIELNNDIVSTGDEGALVVPENGYIRMYLKNHTINRGLSSSVSDGSVFVVSSNAILLMDAGGGTITGGKTTGDGGAFNVANNGTLYVINATISSNSANNGGAVYNAGLTTLANCTVSGNSASAGGAVYNTNEISISGTIQNNTSTGNGGAVYSSGHATLFGTYSNNTASGNGGVAYNAAPGYLEFKNTTTTLNSAVNGGAIYNKSGARTEIIGGTISSCTASGNGGAIYNETHDGDDFKTLTIGDNVSITSCSAGNLGGAVYNLGTIGFGNSTISSNTATNNGGGVYIADGNAFVGGKLIVTGNTVSSVANNLYLPTGEKLILGSGADVPEPATDMSVGVTMQTPGEFTTNSLDGTADNFVSDSSSYAVFYTSDGKLKLAIPQNVTFKTNGGSAIEAQIVAKGDKVVKPSNPTKSGYTFVNWYSDLGLTSVYDFNSAVNADITLYAKWQANPVNPPSRAVPNTMTK